jgi:hypothetical protein
MTEPDRTEPKQCPPVDWYAPSQLLRTGIEVTATVLFGTRADARRLSALGPREGLTPLSRTDHAAPLWFDFAADSGDGFAPTFAVARALASELTIAGLAQPLPASELLILGGDQVYPTPSNNAYEERFCALYERVLPASRRATDKARTLYAVPGNHDWYDGLVEFSRVFCTKARLGPWQTQQRSSYFALQLNERLCVVAVDTQIGGDIDRDQLTHFCSIVQQASFREQRPSVLLITAEPHWESTTERADICAKKKPPHLLGCLIAEIERSGARVVLQLTGDLHHFRHYRCASEGRHLITAGGGGAFAHPTHTRLRSQPRLTLPDAQGGTRLVQYDWVEGRDFPEPHVSRLRAMANLVFFLRKPKFALLLGAIYLLLSLTMPTPAAESLPWVVPEAIANLLLHAERAFVVLLVGAGFVAFTDTSSKWYRRIGGVCHATAHLTASLVLAWWIPRDETVRGWARAGVRLTWWPWLEHGWAGFAQRYPLHALLWPHFVACTVNLLLGALVGGAIWGLYLLVSVNVFKRHSNEAFSSLSIQDYKCFVRMKLERERLTLYPLGLRRTPRKWTWSAREDTWTPKREPTWELIGQQSIEIDLRADTRPRVFDDDSGV